MNIYKKNIPFHAILLVFLGGSTEPIVGADVLNFVFV